jgi:hypothetical protein
MGFIKQIRISQKSVETGFGAKKNGSPVILRARKILRVGVAESSSAQSCKLARDRRVFL